ncbi:tyrosine-type recombinase/integrase [Sediminibacillus terrae]|uniref:site-specific integrase n=1 Tax=Sediminibacillus terrae TaxID=1562106 RepID=UPI001297A798|nr:tyrosine-type recombinase/integrase [Sediminibacillus terrae]
MASFQKYKTKNGYKWLFKTYIGINPETGKPKPTTRRGFQTKKEAQFAAAKLEKEVNDGVYTKESDISFYDYAEKWIKRYAKLVQPGTVDSRRTSVNKLLTYFGYIQLRKITKPVYESMLHDLHEKEAAANTIKAIHSTARLIFKAAMEESAIKQDPTANIDFRFLKKKMVIEEKQLKDNEKFLEKEDLATFLQIAKTQPFTQDYIIFLTLAYTGLRRGELAVLKWSDIDFENQTFSITKTYYSASKRANDVTPVPPKSQASIREIDVDEFVMDELQKHKAWQKSFIMKNRKIYYDRDYVFINTHKYPGYPIPPQNIYEHMKKILKRMEYPVKLAPHSMRHTHASLCIEAEIELRDISERLGHEDMKMLNKIYAHTTKGQKKKTAAKFSNLMNDVRQKISF